MSERLNIKSMLAEPEPSPTIESVVARLKPFLLDTFKNNWECNAEQMQTIETNLAPELVLPDEIDWSSRKTQRDKALSGQYTLNPETATLDWKALNPARIEIIDTAPMVGKSIDKVAHSIIDIYGATHEIPGLEYWQYILEHPDKMPKMMQDDQSPRPRKNYYLTFGSLMRNSDGQWDVPRIHRDGDQWKRGSLGLFNGLGDGYGVFLLKRQPHQATFSSDEIPSLPNKRNF